MFSITDDPFFRICPSSFNPRLESFRQHYDLPQLQYILTIIPTQAPENIYFSTKV